MNFSAAQEPLPSPFTTSTVVIQDLDDPMTNHATLLDAKGKDASTSIGLVQDKTLPDSATPGCYFQDNSANSSKKVSFKSSSLLSPSSEQEGKTDSTHDSVSLQETLPDLHTTSYSTKDFADSEQPAASSNRSSSLLSPGPSQAFAMTTMTHPLDTTTLDDIHDEMLALMQHSLPKSRTRTNVVTTQYTPRGRQFGAYTTRGMGSTHATWRFPKVVQAIVKIAATRPSGFDSAPFLSAQLNAASSLPIHKDKNNDGRSWLIAFGEFEGGRLWLESPVGTEPPPEAAADWQKKLRGEYHSVKNRWLCFDPSLYHCVERVRSGDRRSLALFSPKNWRKLSPQCIDELDEVGFCPPTLAQVAEAEATALPSVGVALSLPSPQSSPKEGGGGIEPQRHIAFSSMGHTQLCPPLVVKRPLQRMGIHHQDAPALRAAGDFDAEAASKDKMRHTSHPSSAPASSQITQLVQTLVRPLFSGEVLSARGWLQDSQLGCSTTLQTLGGVCGRLCYHVECDQHNHLRHGSPPTLTRVRPKREEVGLNHNGT